MGGLATALGIIAEVVPDRTSLMQILFLSNVAYHHAMGQSVTMTDLLALMGGRGGSLRATAFMFFAPDKRNPHALGWVEHELDDDDRRKRYIRLTDEGVEVMSGVIEALRARRVSHPTP